MSKTIIFSSEQNEFIISPLYLMEDCFTFVIKINSGEFRGICSFSIFLSEINTLIKKMSYMYEHLDGECIFHDTESDAFIAIQMLKYGNLTIYGQLGGTHQDHLMKFKCSMDKTILNNLIIFFRNETSIN